MIDTFPAHCRYPDISSENPKSTVVEHHLKHASTKTINQNRRRSKSVDDWDHDRRKSIEGGKSRPIDSSVAVPRFDGSGDLELFLKRFKSVAQYYSWTESEKLFRLEHAMSDNAQYVLMDAPPATSVNTFIDILRSRFGFATNAEHYRAELSHLRRGSLSIKELHLEVRRLVNKAFPGEWSTSTEIYARDAFLSALNDPELRRRVLLTVPPPETLTSAFDLAARAITLDGTDTSERRDVSCSRTNQQATKKQYQARSIVEKSIATTEVQPQINVSDLHKQLVELQSAVAMLRTEPPPIMVEQNQRVGRLTGASRMDRSQGIVCWRCKQTGHKAYHCTVHKAAAVSSDPARANILSASMRSKIKVYLPIVYEGHTFHVLLDTGCDLSVMSSRTLPNLSYVPCVRDMLAANMSPVPILGKATVSFSVAGHTLQHEFLVSDAVEEIIFGSDWLVANRCQWDFDKGILSIGSLSKPYQVQLIHVRPHRHVRRIYARNTVELKPYSQSDVAVRSMWSTMPMSAAEWLVEAKELHPGVHLARTLISNEDSETYVRILNSSPVTCTMEAGGLLAHAELVDSAQYNGNEVCSSNDQEHVECLIDALPSELTPEQRLRAEDFIKSYAYVFSKSASDLGRNRTLPHRINTGVNPPVKEPLRRHPYAHLAEIEHNVQEMLSAKVIEPAQSAWSSNVLLVRKKDGSMRFCVDYRKLNNTTIKDSYPLPRIDSCLESLGGSYYFSTLDLRTGYWQTELQPEDADKTAFVTRSGQYRFTVLSMGLANAPGQFQRLMDLILAGLTFECCLVYLDDIICYSRTFEEHLTRLGTIFDRLAKANLKLKASKCQLFQTEVHFLGHIVSRQGIAADPEKIRTVANWPRPRNLREVRSFLGLSGYYRKFVAGYADIAKPLHMLTNKEQSFEWKEAQEQSFQKLKDKLITAPILSSPADEGIYVLDTDASLTGLGAVLQQKQNEELKVIAYGSRCLSRSEQNYSTTRRELLAMIYGFKQFRQFLLGRKFILRVDHSALVYLRTTRDLMGQAARWLEFIEEYDFDLVHRAGTAHGNCDALSRFPYDSETDINGTE